MVALSTYAIATTKLYAEAGALSNSDGASLIGLIKEPTDEAFNQAVAETRNKNKNNELKNITETH